MKKKSRFVILFFILLSLLSIVVAQEHDAVDLSQVAESLKFFNLASAYQTAPYVVDGILYLILFMGVAQVTLGKRFEGRGGRAVVVALGLTLGFSMAYWSMKTGFTLGSLGPLGFLVLVIILGLFIYKLLRGNQEVGSGIWMGLFALWVLVYVFFPQLITFLLGSGSVGATAVAIFNVIGVIAMFLMIYTMFKGKGPFTAQNGDFPGLLPSRRPPDDDGTTRRPTRRERDQRLIEDIRRLNRIDQDIGNREQELNRIVSDMNVDELVRLRQLGELLRDLDTVVARLEDMRGQDGG